MNIFHCQAANPLPKGCEWKWNKHRLKSTMLISRPACLRGIECGMNTEQYKAHVHGHCWAALLGGSCLEQGQVAQILQRDIHHTGRPCLINLIDSECTDSTNFAECAKLLKYMQYVQTFLILSMGRHRVCHAVTNFITWNILMNIARVTISHYGSYWFG